MAVYTVLYIQCWWLVVWWRCWRAALTQCKLWAIDRSVFKTIMTRTGMQKHADHVDFLRRSDITFTLNSRLYNRLGKLCKWAQPSGAWAVQPGRLWRRCVIARRLCGQLVDDVARLIEWIFKTFRPAGCTTGCKVFNTDPDWHLQPASTGSRFTCTMFTRCDRPSDQSRDRSIGRSRRVNTTLCTEVSVWSITTRTLLTSRK